MESTEANGNAADQIKQRVRKTCRRWLRVG
jgi:hypothetical protein